MFKKKNFKKVRISFLNNLKLTLITNGEVKNSKTLNYKNLSNELDGLFCNKIFGSDKNNRCLCGSTIVEPGDYNLFCRQCDVEVSSSRVRRKNSALYKLNDFFINTLFYKTTPSILSLILNLSLLDIENILYNNYYIVIYSNISFLKINQVISYNDYILYYNKYYDSFYAETGFLAIKKVLDYFNITEKIFDLKTFFLNKKNRNSSVYKKNIKRYVLFKYLVDKDIVVSKIFFNQLFILPPDLRPIVKLPEGNLATSDLNELYKKVIDRNLRLKKLIKLKAPDIVINNEKKNIQDSINKLFDNKDKVKETIYGKKSKVFKSLIANIKGKKGLFRYNLLGKRVDFSGRSVIVSGPHLKLDECAIPRIMAVELFRPFIYGKLMQYGFKKSIKQSKIEVDKKTKLVYIILNELLKNNLVLLNRAPTLHRLGMQSFKALLTNDKTIKLHPLVCAAFNADFDGDQMAVHIPVTSNSRVEYKRLFLSIKNILHPANSDFLIAPTQDIVLGIYYATKIINTKNLFIFDNIRQIKIAYENKLIGLNTKIFLRIKIINIKKLDFYYNIYETTMGRAMIYNILPGDLPYECINKNLKKEDLINILELINDKFGLISVINFSDNLMRLGFYFATLSGISISMDDMIDFNEKYDVVKESKNLVKVYNLDYLNGLISKSNRKRKIINLWQISCNIISDKLIKKFFFGKNFEFNSLSMIMESGARGSEIQLKQICAMRGLIFYRKQGIMETPIISNLREGLSVLEYFYSAHGSRKTLADTALKTSSAGYLTRKLVEVANAISIIKDDCGTNNGLMFKTLINNGIVIDSFLDRILGRVICDDLIDKKGFVFLKKNTLIDKKNIILIENNKIDILKIRSPVTCELEEGICKFCYGLDLSMREMVNLGESVGIIAAQAIGEPGTQLTMRTFHSAGALSTVDILPYYVANNNGYIEYSGSLSFVLLEDFSKLVVSKIGKILIKNNLGDLLEEIRIPYASKLLVNNFSKIFIDDMICEWDKNYNFILSNYNGFVKFENFFENFNFIKKLDHKTGNYNYEMLNFQKNKLKNPLIKIYFSTTYLCYKKKFFNYELNSGDIVVVSNNDFVALGDIIIKSYTTITKATDIIGGLPKVIELFECSIPKDCAVMAPEDCYVEIKILKSEKKHLILNIKNNKIKYLIPKEKSILVNSGQKVEKGDILVNGSLNPHDILSIYGVNSLVDFYLSEVKNIYYLQGVKINDKHIEIVLRQMLKSLLITSFENKKYFYGEILKKRNIFSAQKKRTGNIDNFKFKEILSGITKASLASKSFLSAASFQRTAQVLSKSAIISRISDLMPIKDNTMLGKIIPIGSAFFDEVYKTRFFDISSYDAYN